MNKTSWIGIALLIYGIMVLMAFIPAIPPPIPPYAYDLTLGGVIFLVLTSTIFMMLTGLAFFLLGKDLEKLSKGVEKAIAEKAKEAK